MPNNNYLITGYWGEPHVTAENDRGIHASMFGAGKFVLPVGRQFEAVKIGNNTVRMYDGKLIDNGAIAGIPAGEYVDLLILNAGSGMKRNDLIVFQYERDSSTNRESGTFTVLSGAETTGTPVDPLLLYDDDLLEGNAWRDQIALWRVTVEGTNIGAPVRLAPVVWDNPPMEVGVEYATAEFFNGKRVYTRMISTNWAAGSTHKISDFSGEAPHKFSGRVGTLVLPYSQDGALTGSYSAFVSIHRNDNELNVKMWGGTSISAVMYLQIWYTER